MMYGLTNVREDFKTYNHPGVATIHASWVTFTTVSLDVYNW